MKLSATTFGLSLMMSLGANSVLSAPLPAPSVEIAARPASVKSGQDIRVDINIVNTSNRPMPLAVVNGLGNAEFGCDISVTREDSHPVARTDYGLSLIGKGTLSLGFSKHLISLQPGKAYADYLLVNKIYDVSSPGVYVLQVRRSPTAGAMEAAQSNSIKITVE